MYARNVAKMDILTSEELNQCMACDYTSYEYGEVYSKDGDEITLGIQKTTLYVLAVKVLIIILLRRR